jgi:hypothetical protein
MHWLKPIGVAALGVMGSIGAIVVCLVVSEARSEARLRRDKIAYELRAVAMELDVREFEDSGSLAQFLATELAFVARSEGANEWYSRTYAEAKFEIGVAMLSETAGTLGRAAGPYRCFAQDHAENKLLVAARAFPYTVRATTLDEAVVREVLSSGRLERGEWVEHVFPGAVDHRTQTGTE